MGLTLNIIHQLSDRSHPTVTPRCYQIHHTCKKLIKITTSHQEHQTHNTSPHTIKTPQQHASRRSNMTKYLTEEKETKENHVPSHLSWMVPYQTTQDNLNLYSQLCPLRPDSFSFIPGQGRRQDTTKRGQTREHKHLRKKTKIGKPTMATVPILDLYLK